MTSKLAFAAALCAFGLAAPVAAQEIERTYPTPSSFIASTVTVPPGTELIFLSGQLPNVANASAPSGSVEAYGDTETQAE